MSTGIFGIGVSGIAAAQLALLTTEHNVVNANTPGYTRQRTVQGTNIALNTGAGAIGQGVHVQTIDRMYDRFLTGQVTSAQTSLSEIDAYYGEIKQIDNLLADPSAGLSPALQEFFSGVQQVASNPSLLSARQSMISSAQTLVSRFQSLDARLGELTDEVNGKIQDAVSSVNSMATQIAELNQRIVISESSFGQPANDLLDQRDQLVNDLNKLVKASTSTNRDGTYNVYIGTGQQLVVGGVSMQLTAMAASADPEKIVVGLQTASGGVQELPESLIVGGELGGLVKFRSETLGRATNELGRLAASVALTFNAQNALGQDLLGRAKGDLGFDAESEFFSLDLVKPEVADNANNTGNAVLSVEFVDPPPYGPDKVLGGVATTNLIDGNFYTNLTTSDYRLTAVAGGQFTLTRLSDNTLWGPDSLANLPPLLPPTTVRSEGFTIAPISGVANVGDSFLIKPTANAARNIEVNPVIAADPRTVAAASPFRTSAAATNVGSGAISSGTGVPGFDSSLLPAAGITISYSSATSELSFAVVTAGQTITYKPTTPNAVEVAVIAPATIPYTPGMAVAVSGMSFVISGAPGNGDTFKLERNTAATTDGRNALALGKLQTQKTVAGGSATFQTAYAQMVASNGIKSRELKVTGEAQQVLLDNAQANRDALSGVNLDEEAANMIRFQQAYQASAKILEVGKTLFDTILQIS